MYFCFLALQENYLNFCHEKLIILSHSLCKLIRSSSVCDQQLISNTLDWRVFLHAFAVSEELENWLMYIVTWFVNWSWVTTAVQETLEKKMEIIAMRIYGADGIELSEAARKKVELYTKQVINTLLTETHCTRFPHLLNGTTLLIIFNYIQSFIAFKVVWNIYLFSCNCNVIVHDIVYCLLCSEFCCAVWPVWNLANLFVYLLMLVVKLRAIERLIILTVTFLCHVNASLNLFKMTLYRMGQTFTLTKHLYINRLIFQQWLKN